MLQSVQNFAHDHCIDLIVPLTDATVWPLALAHEQWDHTLRVLAPNRSALEIASDKYNTLKAAEACGIPIPRTVLIQSIDELDALQHWPLPVVIKDRFSVRWDGHRGIVGGVAFAYTFESLRSTVSQRLRIVPNVIVQTFCPGTGIGFACLAIGQAMYHPFEWERVREKDPRGSGSSVRRSLPLDPQVVGFGSQLLDRIGYTGLAMVEFKRREREYYLMEINARPWGSIQLPIHCGIDYPQDAVASCLEGRTPLKSVPYTCGITSRSISDELVHLEKVWEGKPTGWPLPFPRFLPTLLKTLIPWYPGLRYDDLWFSDPKPAIAVLCRWARRILGADRRPSSERV